MSADADRAQAYAWGERTRDARGWSDDAWQVWMDCEAGAADDADGWTGLGWDTAAYWAALGGSMLATGRADPGWQDLANALATGGDELEDAHLTLWENVSELETATAGALWTGTPTWAKVMVGFLAAVGLWKVVR